MDASDEFGIDGDRIFVQKRYNDQKATPVWKQKFHPFSTIGRVDDQVRQHPMQSNTGFRGDLNRGHLVPEAREVREVG